MLLLAVVFVLLLVVGFQLIRGLFFRGGMGRGGWGRPWFGGWLGGWDRGAGWEDPGMRGGWGPEGAPVTLIVGARTEEVQEVLMGEVAAREVRACVPRCKTYS
ncbi:MAG: hypothetical protein DUD31_08845 [Coriobacteriaceae bacterium]|jgi:hypothetical protein|nr:hypothetical protein [Atopobiaceae bacterium]MCI1539701.1 hypothetical protein [Atopobiaceae bacterium]RRF91589.1 MAG: hypothetical protein DUD31_08845 [Coriobacteriaceae bacterium]